MNTDNDSLEDEIKINLPVKRCSQEKNALEDTLTNWNISTENKLIIMLKSKLKVMKM